MDPSPTQRDLLPVNRSIVRVSFQVKGENSHEAKTIHRRTDHRRIPNAMLRMRYNGALVPIERFKAFMKGQQPPTRCVRLRIKRCGDTSRNMAASYQVLWSRQGGHGAQAAASIHWVGSGYVNARRFHHDSPHGFSTLRTFPPADVVALFLG